MPPAPQPEKEETRRTLSLTETLKLVDWLRDNYEAISKSGDSKEKVAAVASEHLKIGISDNTLHRIAKELNMDWKVTIVRKKGVVQHNAAQSARKVIVKTIHHLFDKLGEKLPDYFTEEFGE